MGNIVADLEESKVQESDIKDLENELSVIKGTFPASQGSLPRVRVSAGSDVDIMDPLCPSVDLDMRESLESSPSSPAEFHSARSSEVFSFVEADDGESNVNVQNEVGQSSRSEFTEKSSHEPEVMVKMQNESSTDDENADYILERHDDEVFMYLNPATLSDTGSEVSDFESDFEVDDKTEMESGNVYDSDAKGRCFNENGEVQSGTQHAQGDDLSRHVSTVGKNNEINRHEEKMKVGELDSDKMINCGDVTDSDFVSGKATMSGMKGNVSAKCESVTNMMNEQNIATLAEHGDVVSIRDKDGEKGLDVGMGASPVKDIGPEEGSSVDGVRGIGVLGTHSTEICDDTTQSNEDSSSQTIPSGVEGGNGIVSGNYCQCDKGDILDGSDCIVCCGGGAVTSDGHQERGDADQERGEIGGEMVIGGENDPGQSVGDGEGGITLMDTVSEVRDENGRDGKSATESGEVHVGGKLRVDESEKYTKSKELERILEKQRLWVELTNKAFDLVNSSARICAMIKEYNKGNLCDFAGYLDADLEDKTHEPSGSWENKDSDSAVLAGCAFVPLTDGDTESDKPRQNMLNRGPCDPTGQGKVIGKGVGGWGS